MHLKKDDTLLFWLGLGSIPGVGRSTFRKLINHFGSPERALSAPHNRLKEIKRLSDKVINNIISFPWREHAEQDIAKAVEMNIDIFTMNDPDYPEHLKKISDPPVYIYVKGILTPEDYNALAIVGTRQPTHYGRTITHRLSYDLAAAGLTIVSGLARGIDTQAHRGALSAKGRTIAVLGCGIDIAYPPENKDLIDEIAHNGAIITEYPFGTKPESGRFPARNRIISGLARGTVVVEAAEDSGSLITANNAVEQGRKLFAVPGNIGHTASRGTNNLIKKGAILIEAAADVLDILGLSRSVKQSIAQQAPLPRLTRDEEEVFRHITNEPKHIDSILNEVGGTAGKLGGILISLELQKLVKQCPGKFFIRQDSDVPSGIRHEP